MLQKSHVIPLNKNNKLKKKKYNINKKTHLVIDKSFVIFGITQKPPCITSSNFVR